MAPGTIGLVGLGLVGTALSTLFLRAGYAVLGCDIRAQQVEEFVRRGGRAAASPAEVAAGCRRLVLSLPSSDEVEQVVAGPAGVCSRGHRLPDIVLDTTTGHPRRVERLAAALAARGVRLLDATIAGSSRQILDRQAVWMVGGEPDAHRACADLFAAVSDAVFYMGPPGSGTRAKLAVNLVLGLQRAVLAEGLVFAERLGIDRRAALALFAHTPAYARVMDVKGPKMVKGDFAPEARLRQHRKDVGLILDLAREAGQELPLTQAHAALLDAAMAAGDGERDNSAIVREIARRGPGGGVGEARGALAKSEQPGGRGQGGAAHEN